MKFVSIKSSLKPQLTSGFYNFTFLEQKSAFKLERNTNLTFIVIIIDRYETNDRDYFFGHIA